MSAMTPISSAAPQERSRRQQAALGMPPPDQRLVARRSCVVSDDDRLVPQAELAALHGLTDFGLEPESFDRLLVHRVVEHRVADRRRPLLARYIARSASRTTSSPDR